MDLGLKGKKAVITGGSRGIGRAVAELLAGQGCDVAFCSRNAEQVKASADALRRHGTRIKADPLDIEDQNAYQAWLSGVAEALGGIDIFMHNASSSGSQATMDWQRSFQVDVIAGVSGCEILEPWLTKSGTGSVILMSSTAAVETFLVPQAFNAMKAALITYGKQLSQAWGPKGVRVNVVSPGPIKYRGGNWEYIEREMPDLHRSTLADMPLGRFGEVDEVARAVVFLASPAASYITGVNLVVDGGFTKRVQF
jgi:NAD(P)-dependent dehydrogenase (short-subunit alcohol dehydrogenase family)